MRVLIYEQSCSDFERNGTFIGEAFTLFEKGRRSFVLSHLNGKTQNRRPENSVDFPELAVDRQDGAEPAQRSTSCQQDGRNKGAYRCQLKTGTVQLRQFTMTVLNG